MATSSGESDNRSEHSIEINGTNDMICAKCYKHGDENGAVGICKECKYYLCSQCVEDHRKDEHHKDHAIAFFYCETNLKVNKLVRANSFCLDCGHYLCQKCQMNHRGFREYRHHTFIGGKTGTQDPFEHSVTRKTMASRSSSKSMPRMSKFTIKESGRKSPYLSSMVTLQAVPTPKKRRVDVDKPVNHRPRTLLKTTTGRMSTEDKSTDGSANQSKSKPKSVHYDEDHVRDKAELIGEYELRADNDTDKCQIISSVFLENDSLVVADKGNKNIKLYDQTYKIISSMDVAKFPVALCACKQVDTEFFASSGNNLFLIGTYKGLTLQRTIETDAPQIEGLAAWESGVAIVFKSYRSKADKKGHLEVHLVNYDGDVKYEITISSQFSVKMVTPIWYITTSNDGQELLISDTCLNRIISIDISNWHVVYVLRGKTKGGAPRSLAMDPDGNLLVAWYGEVHKISQHGRDLGVPVSDIDKQSIIVYNQNTEHLVVHSWSKSRQDKFRVYHL